MGILHQEFKVGIIVWKWIALAGVIAILLVWMAPFLPVGIDWQNTYRPATLALLDGKSPYSVEIYYAAPWTLVPLIPFAVLPYELGRMGVFVMGLCAFGYIAYKAGASLSTMVIFLCSAAVVGCLNNGNVEWMPLLGFILPPQFGLILLAVKPQVGIGLGAYWLITIWRDKGLREVVRVFLPVTILLIVSFVFYGFWFLRFKQTLAWSADNTSLGLYGMALGIGLFVRAIRRKNERMAMASSPLLAPYTLQFTWSAILVYLMDSPVELLAVVIMLWVPVVFRVMGW